MIFFYKQTHFLGNLSSFHCELSLYNCKVSKIGYPRCHDSIGLHEDFSKYQDIF